MIGWQMCGAIICSSLVIAQHCQPSHMLMPLQQRNEQHLVGSGDTVSGHIQTLLHVQSGKAPCLGPRRCTQVQPSVHMPATELCQRRFYKNKLVQVSLEVTAYSLIDEEEYEEEEAGDGGEPGCASYKEWQLPNQTLHGSWEVWHWQLLA